MNKYWFIWKWYSIKNVDKRFIYGFRRFNVNFVKTNIFLVSNRQMCVLWLRNKTYVPVFHRGNKIAHSWFNLYVPEFVPISAIKHGYIYFISILTWPYHSIVLHKFVGKAYVDRMSFGWLFLGISINNHFRRLLN